VAESEWPTPRIAPERYWLGQQRLSDAPVGGSRLDFRSPQSTGLDAGAWCGFGAPGEAPPDQRGDDGCSLMFDSDQLPRRLEILGAPVLTLEVAADQPVAFIAARLNDVAPDGASTRVTYGLLNLTHRDGHESPQALESGKRYVVSLKLNHIAHAFPAGHKVRLAVSTCYWPIAWPAPKAATLSLFTEKSFLDVPVRPANPADGALPPFPAPEQAAAERTELRPAALKRIIARDRATSETVYTIASGDGDSYGAKLVRIESIGLEIGQTMLKCFRIGDADPGSARAEVINTTWFCRGEWKTRVETRTRFSSNPDDFLLDAELTAYEGDELCFTRTWSRRVKRHLL
jgi:hypothetical protein